VSASDDEVALVEIAKTYRGEYDNWVAALTK
jgi:hypothetical protein